MGRLIDADALMEKLNVINDRIHGNEHFLCGIKTAKELLEDAPTAYDMEEVVWALECEKTIWCGTKITTTDTMNIDDAIEIVRKGGVD